MFAYQQTIGRLYSLAEELSVTEEVNEILEKRNAFYEIEGEIPSHLKHLLT